MTNGKWVSGCMALLRWPCFRKDCRKGTCEKGHTNSHTEQPPIHYGCYTRYSLVIKLYQSCLTRAFVPWWILCFIGWSGIWLVCWYVVTEVCLVFKHMMSLVCRKIHAKAGKLVISVEPGVTVVCIVVSRSWMRLNRSFHTNIVLAG